MNDQRHTIRDVGILIASLDQDLAGALLEKLKPTEAAVVRRALAGLGEVKPSEAAALIAQFRHDRRPRAAQSPPAGVVLEGNLAQGPPSPAAPVEGAEAAERPFQFLSDADPRSLIPFLQRERPQTVAVVLSSLAPAQAAKVLAALPAKVQVEAIQRLAGLDVADAESLRVVAHELETWLREQRRAGDRRVAGLGAVAGILAAAEPAEKQILVENLHALDHHLAHKVATTNDPSIKGPSARVPPMPSTTFDQLGHMDRHHLMAVLAAAEPELVVLALAGAGDDLANHLLDAIPPPQANRLRRDLDQLGPIRLSDVEAAQEELASLAETLQRGGRIAPAAGRPIMAA